MKFAQNKIRASVCAAAMAAGLLAAGVMATPGLAQVGGPRDNSAPIPETNAADLIRDYELPVSQKPATEAARNWRKPKAYLVSGLDRPDRLAWLQKAVPDVKLIVAPTAKPGTPIDYTKVAGIKDVDGVVFGGANDALLKAAPNLRWIHQLSAGIDGMSSNPSLAGNKYIITNGAKLQTQVAGNAFALLVSLMRGMDGYVRMDMAQHYKEPDWSPDRGWQLDSPWKMIVVGMGGIGTHVAKMAHFGLGMKITATRGSTRSGPEWVEKVGLANELDSMIGDADIVMVTVPITPQTKGMFNTAMFNRMKKGAIFINVGRGQTVVTADLIDALKRGQISAAGLDVTDPEPLPDNHPLWSAPNTLIMTHLGPPSLAAEGDLQFTEKRWILARELMKRYAAGDKMVNAADLERGY